MSEKPIKVFVASGRSYYAYASWILSMNRANSIEDDIKKCNLVLLPGGADISSELYGEQTLDGTWSSESRDIHEVAVAEYAIKHGIPLYGTCRGAQLICVLAGGKLVQDMNHDSGHTLTVVNHKKYESITCNTIYTNSIHHQLQYPYNIKQNEYEIICFANNIKDINSIRTGINSIIDKNIIKVEGEPEVVYYKKINGLGIQGHPELLNPNRSTKEKEALAFFKECFYKTIWK